MQSKKIAWVAAVVLTAATLTSCNIGKAPEPTPDVNAIYTSAAATMVAGYGAQQTQTAAAATPTSKASPTPLNSPTALATFAISTGSVPFGTPFGTPLALNTPGNPTLPAGTGVYSLPVGCDDAMYMGDDGPKDKEQIRAGKAFDVNFQMRNVGTCTWDNGYSFSFLDGDQLSANRLAITIDDKAEFTAPGHDQTFKVSVIAPNRAGEYKSNWQMKNDTGVRFGSIVYIWITVGSGGSATATP